MLKWPLEGREGAGRGAALRRPRQMRSHLMALPHSLLVTKAGSLRRTESLGAPAKTLAHLPGEVLCGPLWALMRHSKLQN